jgi:PhnB protein
MITFTVSQEPRIRVATEVRSCAGPVLEVAGAVPGRAQGSSSVDTGLNTTLVTIFRAAAYCLRSGVSALGALRGCGGTTATVVRGHGLNPDVGGPRLNEPARLLFVVRAVNTREPGLMPAREADNKETTMAINIEPALSPHLVVDNAAAAIDFYVKAFDAVELGRVPRPDGKLVHAALRINGSMVMLADDFPEMCGGKSMTPESLGGTPVTIHLTVDDVDAKFQRALDAGATVVAALEDQFWGDRYGVVADPFGHHWSLGQPVREVSMEEIQAAMSAAN